MIGRNSCGGRRRKSTGGFTFVEVLAALIFLAVVVPAIVTALTLSNKASEVTERGAAAGELAENKLNEMLTADAWQNGSTMAGDCGADWPGYRWETTQIPWTGGSIPSAGTGSAGTSGSSGSLSTGGTSSGTIASNVGNTTLTELKVSVFFKVQGVERSVSLSTVVNSLASSSGTSTTSTGGGTP